MLREVGKFANGDIWVKLNFKGTVLYVCCAYFIPNSNLEKYVAFHENIEQHFLQNIRILKFWGTYLNTLVMILPTKKDTSKTF